MVAIHIFSIIRLGGVNIKRKKSSKPYMSSDNSKVSERRYKQILEANERALWVIYNSLASFVPFGFYPYEYLISPPANSFNK
ncbi:tyrosyl-tRNA synthetase [Clostridium acetobutylicum EA 2018]|nr:tyrosyl-tRNA synthetase [Clostridium acetobutylicum EA 2018]AEI33063.1 tyrosyl-tRNA synthetase [Clostridium acetobutylicum DSM 1731]AWV81952.1 hypothetical protein DK921_18105 [Clostridium acetobutylicum]PSM04239.1 hypothetical protein C7T89_19005 [Clostridium sp. NJ4]MBC2395982.1 hypothetical protein [Clostridium acetobutylicum]